MRGNRGLSGASGRLPGAPDMSRLWDLKLATGKVIQWEGKDGEDAARRYVDCHREAVVVAWRNADRHGLHIGVKPIIEPGDKR